MRLLMVGMSQGVANQLDDMIVIKAVKDMFALPPVAHNPFAAEQFQALRNGGQIVLQRGRDFRDTHFPMDQHPQQSQAIWIPQRTEDGGRPLAGGRLQQFFLMRPVIM
jgi:hypothetical protein